MGRLFGGSVSALLNALFLSNPNEHICLIKMHTYPVKKTKWVGIYCITVFTDYFKIAFKSLNAFNCRQVCPKKLINDMC